MMKTKDTIHSWHRAIHWLSLTLLALAIASLTGCMKSLDKTTLLFPSGVPSSAS